MKKFTAQPVILFIIVVLLCLYEQAEMFYFGQQTSITSLVWIIQLAIGVCATLYILLNLSYLRYNYVGSFIVLFVLYSWIISLVTGGFLTLTLYISTILPAILLLCTQVAARSSKSEYVQIFFFAACVFLSVYYFRNLGEFASLKAQFQNNGAYTILFFLPFILSLDNSKLRLGGIILILLVMITSLKRGGIITMFMALGIYLWIKERHFIRSHILMSLILLSISVGLIALITVSQEDSMLMTFLDRFESIQEDKGSGRLDIFEDVLKKIQGSSFEEMILGHGWCKVQEVTVSGLSAHNDFLEIAYDFGLVGLFLYLMILLSAIRYSFYLASLRIKIAAPFASFIVICISYYNISKTHDAFLHVFRFCNRSGPIRNLS